MMTTLIYAVDDRAVLTIPSAWVAWSRNGVPYRRRPSGVIVAPGDGVMVYFDPQVSLWRPV